MKPTYTDTYGLRKSAVEGIGNAICRYTLMLVPEEGDLLGTGVLISHSGSLYVATTRHFYRDLKGRALFAVPTPFPVKIAPGGKDEISRRHGEVSRKPRFRLPVAGYVESGDLEDVALIRLPGMPAELGDMIPFPLEQARSKRLSKSTIAVVGYAGDLSMHHPVEGWGTFSRIIVGNFTPPGKRLFGSYDKNINLLIRFEHSPGELHPGGMSGGGVWALRNRRRGRVWNPGDLTLVALEIAWYRKHPDQPLKATRIEYLRALLS
jgi:hypothetical protein